VAARAGRSATRSRGLRFAAHAASYTTLRGTTPRHAIHQRPTLPATFRHTYCETWRQGIEDLKAPPFLGREPLDAYISQSLPHRASRVTPG